MGFPEDQVKRALIASGNDINRAVEYCMDPDSLPSPSLTSNNSAERTLLPGAMLLSQASGLGGRGDSIESNEIDTSSSQNSMQLFGGSIGGLDDSLESLRNSTALASGEDVMEDEPLPSKQFIENLKPGMTVDAKDSYGKWYEAIVREVVREGSNETKVLIHFFGWSEKFNEWIEVRSGRVQPAYSMIEPWREDLLTLGTMVECKREALSEEGTTGDREWNIAKVVDVNEESEQIKIQSLMSNESEDRVLNGKEWIGIESERLCKQGTHIVAISTDPSKLMSDPRALAQFLQNPSSLRNVFSAMSRENNGNQPSALSALQKQLGFLAKKIVRGGRQEEPEVVVDPVPMYWSCFTCSFDKNLPSQVRCRLCGAKGIVPRRALVEDLQVVVKDTDSGLWEEGRISSSNDDGSITVTLANGEKDRVIQDPTHDRDDHGVVVQVSSLAAQQEDEDLEQDSMRHQEEMHRRANEEIIRLDGANVLQGATVERVLYSRRTNTESFQRAMASELFISLPKEYSIGGEFKSVSRGSLIEPFKVRLHLANEHLYKFRYGSSLSKREHYLKMKSTVDSNVHTYSPVYLVGQRVEFYWVLESQWFAGMISNYDPLSNLHTVTYDDGEIKQYNLAKKTWRVLSTFELGDIVECWKSTKSMFVPGIIVKVDKKGGYYKVKMFEKIRLSLEEHPSSVPGSKSRPGKVRRI